MMKNVIEMAAVAVAVLSASAFGANVTLYNAETGGGRALEKDGSLVVEGLWDLSECGNLEIEFNAPLEPSRDVRVEVLLENENAELSDLGQHSRGVFKFAVAPAEPSKFILRQIPPRMPEFQEVVSQLDGVRVNGLFDLIWPSVHWGQQGAGGNKIQCWTLDPSRVVRVTVTARPKANDAIQPMVRRISARGPANRVAQMPKFAQIPADKFFPFIDAYGQFKWRDWPGKIRSDADLAAERAREDADLAAHPGPKGRDKWGGWEDGPRFEATGHFYVRKVDGKWWFVDPDGRLWWSHGPVRVSASCGMTPVKGRERYFDFLPADDSPFAAFYRTRDELLWPYYVKRGCTNTYDFTAANLYRKYGENWREVWAERAHRRLRSWGANTIANSSDARVTHMSRTPYCDRFEIKSNPLKGTEKVLAWWPFRDPFDPSFRENVRAQLAERRAELDDPWCFGLFVDNELQWGDETALGRWTWESPDDQPAKAEFRRRLAANGATEPADADFREFSLAIAQAYFSTVRDEIKKAAPRKLYMGCRFSGSAEWVIRAAAPYVDVMSYNCYKRDLSRFNLLPSNIDKPVIIGEFHFGALDRGPIRAGLIQLREIGRAHV